MTKGLRLWLDILMISALFIIFICASAASAGISDGIVASVDDEAITRSELEEAYSIARNESPEVTRREVLDAIVNRRLLLRDARRLKTENSDDEHLLEEYINLKVRALITVSENELRAFYDSNKTKFKKVEYKAVKKEIENYLTEERINQSLKKKLEELRAKARITVLLDDDRVH